MISAFYSEGYLHPDEHFQILEFSNFKLDKSPNADLPWEYRAQIRPSLQPYLVFFLCKAARPFGINDPFSIALILRIFIATACWCIITLLIYLLFDDFGTSLGKNSFLFLSYFLWYIPFLSVRFSSENMSALLFLLACVLLLKSFQRESVRIKLHDVLIGICLASSFFTRFQMGFAIVGLGIYLLFVKKVIWQNLAIILFSGFAMMLLYLYLDYCFYGNFVLTPYNYFFQNIIEKKAASFGVSPWWYYFKLFTMKCFFPLSTCLLLLFIIGLGQKPKHLFIFIIIPFIAVHFAIGHKELRFLIPMTFIFGYYCALGVEVLGDKIKSDLLKKLLLIILVFLNLCLLTIRTFMPAYAEIGSYNFIYHYKINQALSVVSFNRNLYNIEGLPINFYKRSRLSNIKFDSEQEFVSYLRADQPAQLLLLKNETQKPTTYSTYSSQIIYSTYPPLFLSMVPNGWRKEFDNWMIIELKKMPR